MKFQQPILNGAAMWIRGHRTAVGACLRCKSCGSGGATVRMLLLAAGLGQAGHWPLEPLVKPAVPLRAAALTEVDAFIRAKLSEQGIGPSPAADRATLIRRVSYDLTGLPPTSEEMSSFVNDDDPGAYGKLVERLLESPRYGEHWARHWLDVANYADTHGNDHDYARPNAWPYRDYVIKSLNDDKPYARFVQEQIAADALFPENPEAIPALGFLAAGPWDHTLMVTVREDTIDHRSAQNLDRDLMVSTVMGTLQSLTVHCARCHDHKFDPISQREYYSLQAVFAGVDRADRPFDTDARTQAERQRLLEQKHLLQQPGAALHALLSSPEVKEKVSAGEQTWAEHEKVWVPFVITKATATGGTTLSPQPDGSWLAGGTRPSADTYIVTAHRPAGKISALRLEVLSDERLPQGGPGRWDAGNFHLSEVRVFATLPGPGESAKSLLIARATADYDENATTSAAQTIDGNDKSHWGVHPRYGESHQAVFELKEPAVFPEETTFTIRLEHEDGIPGHGIGRFRLSSCDALPDSRVSAPLPSKLTDILRMPARDRTPVQQQELARAVLQWENERALATLPPRQYVYAVTRDFPPDGPNFKPAAGPRPIHLLQRGDLSKPGEPVGPGTISCLPGMPGELAIADAGDESQRRAALARWLTDQQNVLTWRSIVNRVWSYHFGRGLCGTPNDFGKMGGTPSHPELLDWLAIWFRDEAKGSLKALHRLIVSSETWKQGTMADQGVADDPGNRWLWQQNRRRLSGEEVRDTLLALSGRLDPTMGGPPAVQFIDQGNATFMPGGNPAFVDYGNFDPDAPASRRRAIYRFIFRTVPDPLMDALDCPDGGSPTPVRNISTTPVQAFALLNDPFIIRQCGHIAAGITASAATLDHQVEAAFQLILLRPIRDGERAKFAPYAAQHGLANTCQLLINSNEFLHLD